MSDKLQDPSLARRLGRGVLRALSGLFGPRNVRKARDSVDVLKREFAEGKREAEGGDERPPPRRIEHRDVDSDPVTEEEPPPSS